MMHSPLSKPSNCSQRCSHHEYQLATSPPSSLHPPENLQIPPRALHPHRDYQQSEITGSTLLAQDSEEGQSARSDHSHEHAVPFHASNRPRLRVKAWTILKTILQEHWFLLALAILIAIASRHQVSTKNRATAQTLVSYLCVFVIFYVTGCLLPTTVLLTNYKRWKVHLIVQAEAFLMTSAVTFAVVSAIAANTVFMRPELLVGLLFMGCVPTSIASNVVMTEQAHGNLAFAVVESTIGNFLAPFVTPALIIMYIAAHQWFTRIVPMNTGGFGPLYARVFRLLGLSVFLPMALGQITLYFLPRVTSKVFRKWHLSKLRSVSLLIILWKSFDQAFSSGAFRVIPSGNIAVICVVCPALFVLWILIAFVTLRPFLERSDTIAACYCIPAKTPSLGLPLLTVLFLGLTPLQESQIQLPLVLFQCLQILVGSLLTLSFRRWIAAKDRRHLSQRSQDRQPASPSRNTSQVCQTQQQHTEHGKTRVPSCRSVSWPRPISAASDRSGIGSTSSNSNIEDGLRHGRCAGAQDAAPFTAEERVYLSRRMSYWRVGLLEDFEGILLHYSIR